MDGWVDGSTYEWNGWMRSSLEFDVAVLNGFRTVALSVEGQDPLGAP